MSAWAWTEERIERLKALWAGGWTASRISDAFGNGCTRNSVLSKVHRLHLAQRESPIRRTGPAPRRPRATIDRRPDAVARSPRPVDVVRLPEGDVPRPPIVDLAAQRIPQGCRWIYGEPGDAAWIFCQRPTPSPTDVWCPAHRAIAYRSIET